MVRTYMSLQWSAQDYYSRVAQLVAIRTSRQRSQVSLLSQFAPPGVQPTPISSSFSSSSPSSLPPRVAQHSRSVRKEQQIQAQKQKEKEKKQKDKGVFGYLLDDDDDSSSSGSSESENSSDSDQSCDSLNHPNTPDNSNQPNPPSNLNSPKNNSNNSNHPNYGSGYSIVSNLLFPAIFLKIHTHFPPQTPATNVSRQPSSSSPTLPRELFRLKCTGVGLEMRIGNKPDNSNCPNSPNSHNKKQMSDHSSPSRLSGGDEVSGVNTASETSGSSEGLWTVSLIFTVQDLGLFSLSNPPTTTTLPKSTNDSNYGGNNSSEQHISSVVDSSISDSAKALLQIVAPVGDAVDTGGQGQGQGERLGSNPKPAFRAQSDVSLATFSSEITLELGQIRLVLSSYYYYNFD